MSRMQMPEQTVSFRVYHNGTDLIGTATIELPELSYMTETISGSGVAGEIENPTIGITESMTTTLTFTSITDESFNALDWTQNQLYECYASVQVSDNSNAGLRTTVEYRVNVTGRAKTFPLGTLETGKKHENELELETTRLEVLLNGTERLLIDKLAFIHRVNGTDLLATVRAQMGMNV